ncbi:uncharacterized protein LOC132606395 isoform X8 [Lycium barbarum]|uniref:uncharacterized protein LOC132606395 isoform X8 n=1 Tax=Lycium barbarum TaxID=112863 RepID=UPI00293E0689|nr:uncharacterized protein LOC132606395 isoform X8 [Lycium barbarum]
MLSRIFSEKFINFMGVPSILNHVERKRVQRSVVSVVAFLCRWEQIDRVCNTSWTQWVFRKQPPYLSRWGLGLRTLYPPQTSHDGILLACCCCCCSGGHTIWSLKISLLEDSNMMKSWEH